MRLIISLLLLTFFHQSNGQFSDCNFRSPVNNAIRSSGSFGEPRSRHFHGGIDVKPRLGEGRDSIFSIGDGFVSRVLIAPDGYGQAVYIDHPCGHTSVYAHLHQFSPAIEEYTDKVRVATKKSQIDQYPPANAIRIKKGDFIGFMGNSGSSFGAHLHFEIRNTKSETPINPVLFGIGPKDKIPPVIRGVLVYELDNEKKVMAQTYFPAVRNGTNEYVLSENDIITSWPLIGFGVHVFDQSNGASNHNGIHKLKYEVNGEPRFSFSIDSIPFHLSHYLHAHMDYAFKKNNKYVHKCFKDDDNQLSIYQFPNPGAILIPNEIVADQVEIKTADIFGNQSSVKFRIKGDKRTFKSDAIHEKVNVLKKDTVVLESGKFKISFPSRTFLNNETIIIQDSLLSLDINATKQFIPLFKNYAVEIDLQDVTHHFDDLNKITFTRKKDNGEIVNLGGKKSEQTFRMTSSNLGPVELVEDKTAPEISVLNINRFTNVAFRVVDNFTTQGKSTRIKYECLVDNQWVPVEYDEKNDIMRIKKKWILKGKVLSLSVSDFNGNTASKEITLR